MGLSDKFSSAINIFLVGLILYNLFFKSYDRPKIMDIGVADEVTLETSGKLLNTTGQLTEVGWSRRYLKEFSLADVYPVLFGFKALTPLKYKRFNYYSFTFDEKILQVAVSNLSYGANVFLSFYNFDTKEVVSDSIKIIPLIHSKDAIPNLIDDPNGCQTNTIVVKKGPLNLSIYTHLQGGACVSHLKIKWDGIIEADLTTNRNTTEDDLFDIMPISDDNKYFFNNLKSYGNPCHGKIILAKQAINVSESNCLNMIDYGRGIFHYHTSWFWGSALGYLNSSQRFSINLGYGISNKNVRNIEDSVKIDGKVIKLNPLEVIYDHRNLMNGFTFRTAKQFSDQNNSAEITFQSHQTNLISENLLVISSSLRYVYGTYSGRVVDDKGVVIEFTDIPGIIELAKFRW